MPTPILARNRCGFCFLHNLLQNVHTQYAREHAPVRTAVHLVGDLCNQKGKRRIAVCGDVAQAIPEFILHAYAYAASADPDRMLREHRSSTLSPKALVE